MPYYIFAHPTDEEQTVEVFFHMKDEKSYFDESGVEWKRVFTVPQASVKDPLPSTAKEFADYTSKKEGNVGNLTDLAKDLSDKRAKESVDGIDPVKKDYLKNWKKNRKKGAKHSIERSQKWDIVAEK